MTGLMIGRRTLLAGCGALAGLGWTGLFAGDLAWPDPDFGTVDPGAAGFDVAALTAVVDDLMAGNSQAVMVLRGGRIAAERYVEGWDRHTARPLASATKSMVAMLTGMAIDDGFIESVEQSVSAFFPQWRGTPKEAISVRHLLTMTSGLSSRGLKARGEERDQFAVNAAAELDHPPGTAWEYNTPIYHLLFHLVERAAGEPFEAYAQRKLLGPLGMADIEWITNEGKGENGPVRNIYAANGSASDMGRFALFLQRGGVWAGRRLVSADFFRAATSPSQELNPAYGYLTWLNAAPGRSAGAGGEGYRFGETAPRDLVSAIGAGGQYAAAAPSLDLAVVRLGNPAAGGEGGQPFLARICAAVRS